MKLPAGTVHNIVPVDLQRALQDNEDAKRLWQNITPLARNEFICWVENAKQVETRARRIRRTCQELSEGKRRPCCWIGCIHRSDKTISPSVKVILAARSKQA